MCRTVDIIGKLTLLAQLNVLHWHLVDSQSSPMEYFRNPIFLITQYGAYDKTKVYKQDRIKELVAYANFKGETSGGSIPILKRKYDS